MVINGAVVFKIEVVYLNLAGVPDVKSAVAALFTGGPGIE